MFPRSTILFGLGLFKCCIWGLDDGPKPVPTGGGKELSYLRSMCQLTTILHHPIHTNTTWQYIGLYPKSQVSRLQLVSSKHQTNNHTTCRQPPHQATTTFVQLPCNLFLKLKPSQVLRNNDVLCLSGINGN